jgi:hypothetical protein
LVAYNLARQFDEKGLEIDFVFGISKKDFIDAYQEFPVAFLGLIPIIENARSEGSNAASFDSEFIASTRRVTSTVADHPDVIQFVSPPTSSDALPPPLARLKRIRSVVRLAGQPEYEANVYVNL